MLLAVTILGAGSLADERFVYPLLVALVAFPPLWVYLNARTSRVNGAFFWALLALFANIVGLIVYYISMTRGERSVLRACPFCGVESRDHQTHETEERCPSCGALRSPSWSYCPHCAGPLDPPE